VWVEEYGEEGDEAGDRGACGLGRGGTRVWKGMRFWMR